MKLHRIYAIVLRNLFVFKRNFDRWFDAFFNPTLELIIWGITSSYVSSFAPQFHTYVLIIISAISFWFVVTRSQYETNVALLEDIWSRNLINLFTSPLRYFEWVLGVLVIGIIKALATFIFAGIVAFVLYKIELISYGFYLIPFLLLLLTTGWWSSFMITAAIMRFGTRVQTFAWTLIFLLGPFSGIYYPVSSLPSWAQIISKFIPTSYVFEGMRELIQTGSVDPQKIIISLLLNLIYLCIGIFLLYHSYKKLLERGMLQLQ